MAALGIYFRWSLKNLNYIKSYTKTAWIYQCHQKRKKKKEKKKKQIHEILQFFCTNKEKKKNKLIRDKVEIENADMRIIKWT